MASRDTRRRSLPVESTCASSVIAGTWRSSRSASNRRCSSEPADHGSWVVQPSWLSISLMNWPILAGGGFRLLVLDADQRRLAVLEREQHLEGRRRDQRDAYDGGEDEHEFGAQPPAITELPGDGRGELAEPGAPTRQLAGRSVPVHQLRGLGAPAHSMTLSARSSSAAGSVRPSAFAVLRLMIISNLVGCSTGRSAGFAPLRMRPA